MDKYFDEQDPVLELHFKKGEVRSEMLRFRLSTFGIVLTLIAMGAVCARYSLISERELQLQFYGAEVYGRSEETMVAAFSYRNAPDTYPEFIRRHVCNAILESWELHLLVGANGMRKHTPVLHELLDFIDCDNAGDFLDICRELPFGLPQSFNDMQPARREEFEKFILNAAQDKYSGTRDGCF